MKRTSRTSATGLFAVGLAVTALVAGACGSSGTKSGANTSSVGSSRSGSDSAAATKAKAQIADLYNNDNPLLINVPLSKRPPKGKVAYYVVGNNSAVQPIWPEFKSAAKALGWEPRELVYDETNPTAANAAVLQAVAGGANYLYFDGIDLTTVAQGVAVAKSKHIEVFVNGTTDLPGGPSNDVYGSVQDQAYGNDVVNSLLDYEIAQRDGRAHILLVEYPEVPSFVSSAKEGEQYIKSACSGCSITTLDITDTDIGSGTDSSLIVSALRKDPSINVVQSELGLLVDGLPSALASAGLQSKVILTAFVPDAGELQEMASGTFAAGIPVAYGTIAWSVVDAMARASVGDGFDQSQHSNPGYVIWTRSNLPKDASTYEGPPNFQQTFERLWKVS